MNMKKLSLSVAEQLLLLRNGEKIQASKLKKNVFQDLLRENILYKTGWTRGSVLLINKEQFDMYLQNHYSIADLSRYITILKKKETTRSDLVKISTDSKLSKKRSFKGFLVNCYEPIDVCLNQHRTQLCPLAGTFHFIYDFEHFIPDSECTIVGIENPENFRYIENQKYLFKNIKPLFISRYPQSQHTDVINWLKIIPNHYLHFGDYDPAGINIYLNEFKKHIPEKSNFLIPDNIEELISKYGNYNRYDSQRLQINTVDIQEEAVVRLINMIHKYKKGLDQEIFQTI